MRGSCAAESDTAGVFSLRAIWRAYEVCRRRKRHTRNAQRFEIRLLDRLVETRDALANGSWRPSRTLCFITVRPKPREIHAADFGDRVVHHLLVPRLEALFEPVFIHDSYSNRPGKGTHAAVDRLQQFLRQASRNGSRPAWFLQLDIRNFFHTIHRPTLYRLVLRRLAKAVRAGRISAPDARSLAWLTRMVLEPDPAANVRYRGDPRLRQRVPPHKRLVNAPPHCGLPIGTLTSQFFANVYLNELDQFIKHRLRARRYVRYVDDFVLVDEDPGQLRVWREAIAAFLAERLRLELKEVAEPRPVSNGVDFLGYIVHVHHRLVRRRVVGNLREQLNRYNPPLPTGEGLGVRGGGWLIRLPRREREGLRAMLASYLGHFRHADARRLTRALWDDYPWLDQVIRLRPDGGLEPRWQPRSVSSLVSQWRFFHRQGPGVVLMQVGRQVEAYGEDARTLQRLFRIQPARTERPVLGLRVALPPRAVPGLLKRLERLGVGYRHVVEDGYLKTGFKRRVLRAVYCPDSPLLLGQGGVARSAGVV